MLKITIEGPIGAGKTTVAEAIRKSLTDAGCAVKVFETQAGDVPEIPEKLTMQPRDVFIVVKESDGDSDDFVLKRDAIHEMANCYIDHGAIVGSSEGKQGVITLKL